MSSAQLVPQGSYLTEPVILPIGTPGDVRPGEKLIVHSVLIPPSRNPVLVQVECIIPTESVRSFAVKILREAD